MSDVVARMRPEVGSTRNDAQPLYDSAERREQGAGNPERRGVGRDAVSAKTAADISQAKPATAVVKAQQEQSTKVRSELSRPPRVHGTEFGR